MFDRVAIGVSPPLRPIVPSSLNSPYINSEPYIGAWPYKSGEFWGDLVFSLLFEYVANVLKVFCVIECWMFEMLCAIIVLVYA
jgi:hypothetical protein